MKALEKDRTRRYESAADFARDVFLITREQTKTAEAYQGEKEQRELAEANAVKAQENATKAERNYETARQAVDQMLTRVADEQLSRIPEMKEIRRRLLEDAVAFYNELLKLNPRDPRAYFERGRVFDMLQQYDKIKADYERAIQLDPDNAKFHHALARSCRAYREPVFHDLKCASLHMNWALRLDPQNSEYHYELASVCAASGEKGKAVAEMRKAPEFSDPNSARGMRFLANASDFAGDVRGALEWAKKALALAPDDWVVNGDLAGYYLRLGEYENAIAAATKAIELCGKARTGSAARAMFYFYGHRADAYAARGMYREAIADCDKAVEMSPFWPSIYKRRADANSRLGNYDKALADFGKAIELEPKNPMVWVVRGDYYWYQQKRWDEAIADFEKYIALKPNSAVDYNSFAWSLATCPEPKARKPGRAVELAKKAVAIAPKEGTYWRTLGAAQCRAGDHKAAIETLGKAMELRSGGDAFDWFFLAMAHWQLKNKDDARRWYDKAVEWTQNNEPDNKELARFRDEAAKLLAIPEKPPAGKENTEAKPKAESGKRK